MKQRGIQSGLDPWYVSGICEIAGSFTFSKTMRNFAFYFSVKLPQSDEDLLNNIQKFFGAGTIYIVKPSAGSTNPALYYRVTGIDQLQSVLEHFGNYPVRGKQFKRYLIWKEMVLVKQRYPKRKRLSQENFNRLNELAQRLSQPGSRRDVHDKTISSRTDLQ